MTQGSRAEVVWGQLAAKLNKEMKVKAGQKTLLGQRIYQSGLERMRAKVESAAAKEGQDRNLLKSRSRRDGAQEDTASD